MKWVRVERPVGVGFWCVWRNFCFMAETLYQSEFLIRRTMYAGLRKCFSSPAPGRDEKSARASPQTLSTSQCRILDSRDILAHLNFVLLLHGLSQSSEQTL